MVRKLNAAFDYTIGFLAYLAGIILFITMVIIFTDVTATKVLNRPLPWAIEVSEYSLTYITFFCAAWLLKEERHVKMDLLLNQLQPRKQALLNMATSIVGVVVCLVIAWYGTTITWEFFQRGVFSAQALEIPMAPLLAVIPLGTFLFGIQFARRAYGYMRSWKATKEEEQGLERPERESIA